MEIWKRINGLVLVGGQANIHTLLASKTYLHALKIDAWPSEGLQFESIKMYAIISSINWK